MLVTKSDKGEDNINLDENNYIEKDENLPLNKIEKEKKIKKIKIMENNIMILKKELNIYSPLNNIRKKLLEINFPFIFLDCEEKEILKKNECNKKLKDILDGKVLYIKKEIIKREIEGEKLSTIGNLNFYLYPRKELTYEEKDNSLNIIVVGETGVGKSTFLHSILNYLEGIQIEEKDRFYLFKPEEKKEGHSITDCCTTYNIKPNKLFKFPLRIIDTPGFGDTRGEERDEKTILNFEQLFKYEIEYLNAVLIVFKASDTRDHKREKKIINDLLSLFGFNIIKNIIIVFTFADDFTDIKAIGTLKDQNGPFKQILGNFDDYKFYAFNNQAYFTDNIENFKIAFKNNTKNYKELLEHISQLKNISLKDSEKVIQTRFYIKNEIYNLINKLNDISLELNSYNKNLKNYEEIKNTLMEVCKRCGPLELYIENVPYYMSEIHWENCEENMYILYCETCKKVCHSKCRGPKEGWHESEYGCNIISTFLGKCSNCKCHHKNHRFKNTRPVLKEIRKIIKVRSYRPNTNKLLNEEDEKKVRKELEEDISNVKETLKDLKSIIEQYIEEGIKCIKDIAFANKNLNKIALKKDEEKFGFTKEILKERKEKIQNKEIKNISDIFESEIDSVENVDSNYLKSDIEKKLIII